MTIVFEGIHFTKEQGDFVEAVKTREDVMGQSASGSGKTLVCRASASELDDFKGLYLAFNKAIADEAGQTFGRNTDCRTGHSLAYRDEGYKYRDRFGKITGMMIVHQGYIGDISNYPTAANKGYMILDGIRKFCYSDDTKVSLYHMPAIKGPFTDDEVKQIKEELVLCVQETWDKICQQKSTLPILHDYYLKIWALKNPQLHKDFILFDEAQDANPVILGIVKRQMNTQKVYVGDKFQQIYDWRGAINAMDKITTDHHISITQSFRFGQGIADMANKILGSYMPPSKRPKEMVGFEEKDSIISLTNIEDFDVLICRTNKGVIANVFKYLEEGKSVYVQGGVIAMITLLRGANDLMNGKKAYASDLALFNTWEEVIEFSETESGMDLRSLVNLIKMHGVSKLLEALNCTQKTKFGADITITTAHKAKGLEWGKVKLYNDFKCPSIDDETGEYKPLAQGEINVLYVAATRALDVLDISSCAACHDETLFMGKDSF